MKYTSYNSIVLTVERRHRNTGHVCTLVCMTHSNLPIARSARIVWFPYEIVYLNHSFFENPWKRLAVWRKPDNRHIDQRANWHTRRQPRGSQFRKPGDAGCDTKWLFTQDETRTRTGGKENTFGLSIDTTLPFFLSVGYSKWQEWEMHVTPNLRLFGRACNTLTGRSLYNGLSFKI